MQMEYIKANVTILIDALLAAKNLLVPYKIVLVEVRNEKEDIKTFVFRPSKKIRFKAGQYGVWFLPTWVWGKPARLFTIASSPEEETIQLSTHISSSNFKQKLSRLKPGDVMYIYASLGRTVLPEQLPSAIVLIAGGIGITAMHSLAKHVRDSKLPIKVTLIHSAKQFYLYKDEMVRYADEASFVTRETFEKQATSVISQASPNTIFYVSGPPAFVNATEAFLKQHGIINVKKDGFLGY
jgi:ferredoxin-NADP reductase